MGRSDLKTQPRSEAKLYGMMKNDDEELLENDDLKVFFKDNTVQVIEDKHTGNATAAKLRYKYYYGRHNSTYQNDGAYIFILENGDKQKPTFMVPQNLKVHESRLSASLEFLDPVTNTVFVRAIIRLAGDHLEITHTAGPLPTGINVISAWETSIQNINPKSGNAVFYTDSNGREMLKREVNVRDWPNFNQTAEVCGNYYPVVSAIGIADEVNQFVVLTDASESGASLQQGQVDLMTHRTSIDDDSRGVGEPMNETQFVAPYYGKDVHNQWGHHYGPKLIVTGQHWVHLAAAGSNSWRSYIDQIYSKPLPFFGGTVNGKDSGCGKKDASNAADSSVMRKSFLGTELPSNVQMVSLQRLNAQMFRLAMKTGEELRELHYGGGSDEPVKLIEEVDDKDQDDDSIILLTRFVHQSGENNANLDFSALFQNHFGKIAQVEELNVSGNQLRATMPSWMESKPDRLPVSTDFKTQIRKREVRTFAIKFQRTSTGNAWDPEDEEMMLV